MKLELLISALNLDAHSLIEKMNIRSDAVLVNQCDREGTENISLEAGTVRVFYSTERGVGKSRNMALSKATGDILLFSDEDIVYLDNYAETVVSEFEKHPEADGLFFNVDVCKERRTYFNEDNKRVHIWNGGRYPAYSIAVRRNALEGKGIAYSLLFGGGAKYSCGEDSLFIRDCLKAGLKMYRTTAMIGKEIPRPSTWFNGYNEKFFFDRGVLYHFLYGKLAWLMGFRFVYTKRSGICNDMQWKKAYSLLLKGIKEGKKESLSQSEIH